MTARKAPGISFESWIDVQIKQAYARGEFDNLEGQGKPIANLHEHHDENWWIRGFMEREGVEFLPESLQLRRDVERSLEGLPQLRSEMLVREYADKLNARIKKSNRSNLDGPPTNLGLIDADALVARWSEVRVQTPAPARPTKRWRAGDYYGGGSSEPQKLGWAIAVLASLVVGGLVLAMVAA